jgi:hypothetical protein
MAPPPANEVRDEFGTAPTYERERRARFKETKNGLGAEP